MLDLAAGDSLDVVAKRYTVPKATVQKWAAKVKERMGTTPALVRENAFDQAIQEAAVAFARSLKAQGELTEDRTWLLNMTAKAGGIDDVIKLSDSIGKRLVYIVQFASVQAPQLPKLQSEEPAIEAELVDV